MPGYGYCRVHGFGRIRETPWYESGIFLALATTAIAVAFAYYFYSVGPSLKNQKHILSKQEETLKIATNLPPQLSELNRVFETAQREQAMAGKLDLKSGQHNFPIISCGGARFCQFDPSGTIFCDDGEPLVSIRRGEDGRVLLSAKIRNEKGEEVARQVVGVGALGPKEERTFTLAVEVFAEDGGPRA